MEPSAALGALGDMGWDDSSDEDLEESELAETQAPAGLKYTISGAEAAAAAASPLALDLGDIYGAAPSPAKAAPAAVVAAIAPSPARPTPVAAVAAVAVAGAPVTGAVAAVAAVAVVAAVGSPPPAPIDLGLGDIYGTASAAPAAAAVVEAPAAAEVPATAAGAEEFDGPDPTGKICKWQFNAADGWCYSADTTWMYNPSLRSSMNRRRSAYSRTCMPARWAPHEPTNHPGCREREHV